MNLYIRGLPLLVTLALTLTSNAYSTENQLARGEGERSDTQRYNQQRDQFNRDDQRRMNNNSNLQRDQLNRDNQIRLDNNADRARYDREEQVHKEQLDRAAQLRSEQKTIYDEGYQFNSDQDTWNSGGTATDPIIVVPDLSNIDNTINE